MPIDIDSILVYRIIPIANLDDNLKNGLYSKNNSKAVAKNYKTIGNKEIIELRGVTRVKCYPNCFINDFVPFYFSIRTPMLYNIFTGKNVDYCSQSDIIYLCFKLTDLTTKKFRWCYTDGNAAKAITKFYRDLDAIDINIDWRSINTRDFR